MTDRDNQSSAEPRSTDASISSDEDLIAALADDFAARVRGGKHPAIEEYVAKHPELGDRIRKLFPAIAAMEGARTVEAQPSAEPMGAPIGRYKLLERIGEGGFGVVYMAEQQQPVRRKVALKVIKPGMDSRQVLARFEAERQALAIMDHPNIAKVFDGGMTDSNRPYFVMELVKGVPITEFCDQQQLTPRQRLELFLQVCHAVQHAHQKGIIHRDLKPSNVLVAMNDTTPVVKVIDFGVAKALGGELTDMTLFTGFAQLVGTPLYMSPEQAGQSAIDVDTRSDIYSLGVLLYELLTGTTPFDKERFRTAAHDEIRRIIREEEPPKPSTRLSASNDSLASISEQRHTEPAKLTRLVRGDLDWIVMKALEKDRNRRYETASGVAMDVQRYLADEAVQACPPSVGYRMRKFVRRNKGRVLAAAALALSLLAGVAAVLTVKAQATREREAAQLERVARDARTTANVASAVRDAREHVEEAWKLPDFPERMQHATDVAVAALRRAEDVTSGGTVDETTLSDLGSARLEVDQLARHTRLINARAANTQEFAEMATGQDWAEPEARFTLRSAVALREFGLDPVHNPAEEVAQAVASSRVHDILLGMLLDWHWHSRGEERPYLERVIRSARQRGGGSYARWQDLLDANDVSGLVAFAASPDGLSFGPILTGAVFRDLRDARQYAACQTFLRAAIERYPYEAWFNFDLADICQKMQPAQYAEALRHSAAATALRPDSAVCHLQLGDCYADLGLYDQAVAAYRRSIRLGRGNTVGYIHLGNALAKKKDGDGAIASFSKAIEIDPKHAMAYYHLGNALRDQKKLPEATEAYCNAVAIEPKYADAYYNLGVTLSEQNKVPEALEAYRKTIEINPKHPYAYILLGRALLRHKQVDEAIEVYRKGIAANPKNTMVYFNLGKALEGQGKLDESIACFRKIAQLDPNFAAAQISLAWLLTTCQEVKLRDAPGGLEAARKAVELEQSRWSFQVLGWAHYRTKDWKASIEALERSCALDTPKGGGAGQWFFLAMAHWRLGEKEKAHEYYERAVEWTDNHAPNDDNLRRFRAEAAELLELKPQSPEK